MIIKRNLRTRKWEVLEYNDHGHHDYSWDVMFESADIKKCEQFIIDEMNDTHQRMEEIRQNQKDRGLSVADPYPKYR